MQTAREAAFAIWSDDGEQRQQWERAAAAEIAARPYIVDEDGRTRANPNARVAQQTSNLDAARQRLEQAQAEFDALQRQQWNAEAAEDDAGPGSEELSEELEEYPGEQPATSQDISYDYQMHQFTQQ